MPLTPTADIAADVEVILAVAACGEGTVGLCMRGKRCDYVRRSASASRASVRASEVACGVR